MKYLATFIGQGKIFLRPIQEDLALESNHIPQTNVQVKQERCKRCHALPDVYDLRAHYEVCSQENSGKAAYLAFRNYMKWVCSCVNVMHARYGII